MTAPVARARDVLEPTAPSLELRRITVRFGGVVAVKDVSVNLEADRITALIGPNGAGKTTILNVASGVLRPSEGDVFMNGHNVSNLKPWKRARLGMARTFQRVSLFNELTVREHLLLGAVLQEPGMSGLPRAGMTKRRSVPGLLDPSSRAEMDWLIDDLELGPVIDSSVMGLPLGTARLVNLARALLSKPSVLLMDEPASGLGAAESTRLASAIRRVASKRSVAMMVIEHNLDFVSDLCGEIVVLDFGEVIAHGPPSAVLTDERVRNAYMGGYEAVAREQEHD